MNRNNNNNNRNYYFGKYLPQLAPKGTFYLASWRALCFKPTSSQSSSSSLTTWPWLLALSTNFLFSISVWNADLSVGTEEVVFQLSTRSILNSLITERVEECPKITDSLLMQVKRKFFNLYEVSVYSKTNLLRDAEWWTGKQHSLQII